MVPPEYALGHSDPEVERLQIQAKCLEGVSRRLLRDCGIGPGMRVLDLGCGVGDLSMLIAEAVGPNGVVLGIDREEKAIEVARARAKEAGFLNTRFSLGADDGLEQHGLFDAAVGRYVLVHQPNPPIMIRHARDAVRPGGIVAFLECAFPVCHQVMPKVEILDLMMDSIQRMVQLALPSPGVAGNFITCFEDAGLPAPQVFWESIVTGADPMVLRWGATSYRVFLPHIERLGLKHAEVGAPDTLYERLVEAMKASRAQFVSQPHVGAWAVRP